MNPSAQTETPGSMEIISTRDFAAPRETLFSVFADPAELAQWWGPKGFTNTITLFDFRPGGTRLTWRMLFDPNDENERIRGFIVEANEQNFDRLEAYLAARTSG